VIKVIKVISCPVCYGKVITMISLPGCGRRGTVPFCSAKLGQSPVMAR
jgi:hypothetical protein